MRFWLSLVLIMFLSSCAYVYQVQVGDIDDRESFESSPFEIKVSEKGFNLEEAGEIAEALGSDSGKEVGIFWECSRWVLGQGIPFTMSAMQKICCF